MTPAEFKTLREGMGLAAEEVATLLGVTRKTVFALESPTRLLDVPEEHAEALSAFHREFLRAVSRARRRKALPRFTDEERFQAVYGAGLPISVQGSLLYAAEGFTAGGSSTVAPIDYES